MGLEGFMFLKKIIICFRENQWADAFAASSSEVDNVKGSEIHLGCSLLNGGHFFTLPHPIWRGRPGTSQQLH